MIFFKFDGEKYSYDKKLIMECIEGNKTQQLFYDLNNITNLYSSGFIELENPDEVFSFIEMVMPV